MSSVILGMGKEIDEFRIALLYLRHAGCDLVTVPQSLRPISHLNPVERLVRPEELVDLGAYTIEIRFAGVISGPLVRSSYRAGRLHDQTLHTQEDALRGLADPTMTEGD